MTLHEYATRNIPEYSDYMYLDGYEPWEIMEAAHKKLYQMIQEREEAKNIPEVHISSEVKIR